MQKMGCLLDSEHGQCHAHGIHLAICDVLYVKMTAPVGDEEEDVEVGSKIINFEYKNNVLINCFLIK